VACSLPSPSDSGHLMLPQCSAVLSNDADSQSDAFAALVQ
jgi:hypothetical protein